MNEFVIVAYYTKATPYEAIAQQYLVPSLAKLNIDADIIGIPRLGNWQKNTSYKPAFAKWMLEKHKKPIVMIDVDAEVKIYPRLFAEIPEEFDVAAHYLDWETWYHNGVKNKELLSGTLFLRNSERVMQLIESWKLRCMQSACWEQVSLSESIVHHGLKVYPLPIEYCYIKTLPDGSPPHVQVPNPVIVHYQASRQLRRKV